MEKSSVPPNAVLINCEKRHIGFIDRNNRLIEVCFPQTHGRTDSFMLCCCIAIAQHLCESSGATTEWKGADQKFLVSVIGEFGWKLGIPSVSVYWNDFRHGRAAQNQRVRIRLDGKTLSKEDEYGLAKELFQRVENFFLGPRKKRERGRYIYWRVIFAGDTKELKNFWTFVQQFLLADALISKREESFSKSYASCKHARGSAEATTCNVVLPDGAKVRRLRIEMGLTQQALSEEIYKRGIRISVRAIARIEGGAKAQLTTIAALADALCVEPKDLLQTDDEDNYKQIGEMCGTPPERHVCSLDSKTTYEPKGDTEQILRTYSRNLISEIHNNLVLELYDKPYFEDICITPLVRRLDEQNSFTEVHEVSWLVGASRSVILGEPGSGKTYALRKLALDFLRQSPVSIIPIYISLALFVKSHTLGEDSYCFKDHIDDELRILGCPSLDYFSQLSNKLILLLLDGWDEIQTEESRNAVKRYLSQTPHHCITTSRPEALRSLPPCDRYEMEPLTLDRIRELVRLRIKNETKVDELIQWISSSPSVRRLAKNPLNLSIITIIFMEEGSISNLTKTKLYERAFDAILRQHYKAHPYQGFVFNDDDQTLQVESILQHLAYETITRGQGRFFSLRQLQLSTQRVLSFVPTNLPSVLAGRLGIVRDRRSGRFEFFHTWYQEFLAARHILELNNDLIKALDNPKLSSSLFYVVGLMPSMRKALKLMKEVTIHDPFSYCRAISEGGFSDDATRELLLRVITWSENSLERIPVRVEMSRALAEAGLLATSVLYSIARDSSLSDYTRRSALEAIALSEPNEEQFDQLLLELLQVQSQGLLWHTLEHIGMRCISGAKEQLRAYAENTDPITAGDAIWALSRIDDDEVGISSELIDGLCNSLMSDDAHVQGHALRTIGRLKVRKAIPKLREHLKRHSAHYRWIVPQAASLIAGDETIDLLNAALCDRDIRVVAMAIQSFGEVQSLVPTDIIDKISDYTNDSTWLPFLNQTMGSVAMSTIAKLKRKGVRGKLAQIYVARHCKTSWNLEGKLQGKKDLMLCEAGIIEARKNAINMQSLGIDRIFSSNTRRARETTEVYAEFLKVPVHSSPRLREIDHGNWEGQDIGGLLAKPSSTYGKWMEEPISIEIPGSNESITSAQQRILEEIRNIAQSFRDETVLIISHKHIIATLMCGLHKISLKKFCGMIDESIKPRLLSPEAITNICKHTSRR